MQEVQPFTKNLVFVILFMLSLTVRLWGQINVSVDLGVFRYDNSQVYTEIYYSIPIADLKFVEMEEGLQAQVKVHFVISKDGSEWRDEAWRMERVVDDSTQIETGDRMVDMIHYLMEPGTYRFNIDVADLNDSNIHLKIEKELTVEKFPVQDLSLSDIELASSIKKIPQDPKNVFFKNGLEVIPNPSGIYGKESPLLYYYIEAYNLAKAIAGDVYKTRCQVTDAYGHALETVKPRHQVKKKINASVEVGAVNVSSVPSGLYSFNFEILDEQDEVLKLKTKKFYVYNPDIKARAQVVLANVESAVASSKYASMTEKELDSEFEKAQYAAAAEEKDFYKQLQDSEAKRRYIYEFWAKRDPSPQSVENEFQEIYEERIEYTNENFRSFSRKGWKTDRGRVYLIYGPPSDIERFPNNALSYIYQIWHYDEIEGGVIFVFADLQEFGEYMQIHSTKRGEPINEKWGKVIQKN